MENGTRVRDCKDHLNKGTVIGKSHSDPDMLAVEWDDGKLERCYEDSVEEFDDQMEKDFELIKEKMQTAIKLMQESNELARTHGYTMSEKYYELGLSSIFSVLDDAGWNSSSMSC